MWPSLRHDPPHATSAVPAYGLAGLEGHRPRVLVSLSPGLPPRSVRPPQLDHCSLTHRRVRRPPLPALPAPSRSGAGPALVDYPWRAECLHGLFVQQPLLPTAAQGQGGKGRTGRRSPFLALAHEWPCLAEPGPQHQASLPFDLPPPGPPLTDPGPRVRQASQGLTAVCRSSSTGS